MYGSIVDFYAPVAPSSSTVFGLPHVLCGTFFFRLQEASFILPETLSQYRPFRGELQGNTSELKHTLSGIESPA
jgi:hypothetical protein